MSDFTAQNSSYRIISTSVQRHLYIDIYCNNVIEKTGNNPKATKSCTKVTEHYYAQCGRCIYTDMDSCLKETINSNFFLI